MATHKEDASSLSPDTKDMGALTENHIHDDVAEKSSQSGRPLNAIEALNMPDWEQKEKKLVRILDMTLLPTLWILYLFNYLDRTNIAQARLNSFEEDLGLEGNDFNIAVSILTAG